jgi:GNAT superfamily N-acetyltransferase
MTKNGYRPEVVVRPLGQPGDLGWVIMAHGEQYASEFGWNTDLEAYIAQIVTDYAATHDPTREQAWIAEVDGRRVGCVSCVRKDNATAQLRILLVTNEGRGRGLGGRLVQQCIDFARAAGYKQMVLWTNDALAAARNLYLEAGFQLTEEEPHHSFGVDLVGQTYQLDLTSLPSSSPQRR